MMPAARPRPRVWNRFMTRLLPTDASATIRRSTSRLWLFAALAIAELVTDHLLGDVHRDEFPAVVDAERQADELRQDRAAPRPGLDHFAAHAAARLLGLLDQAAFDEGAFPDGTCHCLSPSASHGG